MDVVTPVGIGDIKSPMVVCLTIECAISERKELMQVGAKGAETICSLQSCGGRAVYRTADDIPLVDVPCPCGDPNHWLIKWINLEESDR